MSEVMDLTVIEINQDQAPTLYVTGGLNGYLEQIRDLAKEVPDVTTKKGRDRIGSLARMVGSSKTAIEKPGREYLKRLKEAVKPAEEELRVFTRECDAIRDAILKPRDEWEAEQDRIKAEEAMLALHVEALAMNEEFDRQLAARIESDHEMALLMNDAFDREQAEKKAEAERQRIAREEEIKRQAEEKAKREAEEKHRAELEASARREAEERAAKERAERERIEAQQRAERDRIAAEQKAEADKQAAIEAERRKAQEEADRIRREAEQREQARLAEEKRKAEEEARRAADVEHRRGINTAAVQALINQGIPHEWAKACIIAVALGKVPATTIKY
ncbi:hypothetical protein HUZ43_17845 [Raoultella ornithinolytica]|uniref:hypothetical protein n=1 Tax=Raoultella ornithinolytica TaxID=54291 RepID=UPI001EF8A3AB|nr:hypothetical protein [Raoultella ornithinolytica]ULI45855.1 hypothetical protein HUZ43_17845 [Raoultella ornithinolytica]